MFVRRKNKFKVTLMGDSTVGKTSIVMRLCKNQFYSDNETTIGASFLTHNILINDDKIQSIKMDIWDTA
jgi:GTPase SAR1 family protein